MMNIGLKYIYLLYFLYARILWDFLGNEEKYVISQILRILKYFIHKTILKFTTRKKVFVNSFSPSRYGIYVKICYHSYMSSMPVSRKVKKALTFTYVKVVYIFTNNCKYLIHLCQGWIQHTLRLLGLMFFFFFDQLLGLMLILNISICQDYL